MVLTREQRMKESGCNDEMRIIGAGKPKIEGNGKQIKNSRDS